MMRPNSARGQSSVVGVVLLLGITIVGTGAVVALGGQAFADTERAATVSQAEHSLTQFDSQAAIVALGESSSQRVDLGSTGDGEFAAENDSGRMWIVHHNATGEGEDETIYNESMGSVSYRNGDVEIGYQGGGVWERNGNGSTMRSPPEFNYRGATLTLPAIQVNSNAESTGRTTAVVTQADNSRVYPDKSKTYIDNETEYSNPVNSGDVTVTVQSRFYQGWAEFFRTRTAGNVSVDHERERASVKLVTTDTVGEFDHEETMDKGLIARGQSSGHSLTDFNTTFKMDEDSPGQGKGANTFYNTHIGYVLESGSKVFEYVVHIPGDDSEDIDLSIFYKNTQTGVQHEWSNDSLPFTSGPIQVEDGGTKLTINLTAGNETHGTNLTYGTADDTDTEENWDGEGTPDEIEFEHDDDGEPNTYGTSDSDSSEATSYLLARHYIALLGDEFTITGNVEGNGNLKIDNHASGGTFDYESGGGGTYITYLHVTENSIEVDLE